MYRYILYCIILIIYIVYYAIHYKISTCYVYYIRARRCWASEKDPRGRKLLLGSEFMRP